MIKGFVIRIYPTTEQKHKFFAHIGCSRYIWNHMLELQNSRHSKGLKHLSAYDMIKFLTPLKNDGEHAWLYDVSNASLQNVCKDLAEAYKKFFSEKCGYPKFKAKKKAKPVYPVRSENFYFADEQYLNIEKVGKVKYKTDCSFPAGKNAAKYSNVRVTYNPLKDRWYISLGIDCENQATVLTDKPLGIDLGIKNLAIAAYDDKCLVFANINKSAQIRRLKKNIKHIQKSISRKYEANKVGKKFIKTNNIVREEEKLRALWNRLTNIRMNYIHQTTHKLVSLLPSRVIMEDLNIKGMMKNKHLSKSISEECWGEFIRQMKYKCERLNIPFLQADRFYASSKICSCCGHKKTDLRLKDRIYHCNYCGTTIDRDFNAALNLNRYVI
jgi:transposase, IS605 OrfB family, central region